MKTLKETNLFEMFFRYFIPFMFHVTVFGLYFDSLKIRFFLMSTEEQWKVAAYYKQMYYNLGTEFRNRIHEDTNEAPALCVEGSKKFKQLLKDFKADLNYYI